MNTTHASIQAAQIRAIELGPHNLKAVLAAMARMVLIAPQPYLMDKKAGRPSAVLMALVLRDDALCVVLTERPHTMQHHASQIAFAGGVVEAGETASQCALREASEEIGLSSESVRVIGYLPNLCTRTGFQITPVVAWIHRPPEQYRMNKHEVVRVFEWPLATLMQTHLWWQENTVLPDGSAHSWQAMDWPPALKVADGNHPKTRLWGATAAIMVDFMKKLSAEYFQTAWQISQQRQVPLPL